MANVERLSLLHKVATLYYEKGLKKYDIAHEIKQSPTQVGLLLKEAIDEKIVNIEINLPRFTALQESLKKRFNLYDVIVVPSDNNTDVILQNLSKATAEYFEENVKDGDKVAVGGGYLTYKMIERLPDKERNIDIYPTAIIGRGPTITHIDPIVLVTLLWTRSGHCFGKAHYFTITPQNSGISLEEIHKHYENMKNNLKLQILLNEMRAVDFVFMSVGSLEADKEYVSITKKKTQNLLDELGIQKEMLIEQGGIGDIGYSFFDVEGNPMPEWNIFPSIGIEQLKKISQSYDRKVVVSVGNYKINSLRAILKGKLCNVLITDADAARTLISDKAP